MISEGKVIKVNADKATVLFKRQSACGGNCASCAGCEGCEITAEAENSAGAKAGDTVIVESKTSSVLKTAFIVYICPVISFVASYFIFAGRLGEAKAAFVSAAVFLTFLLFLKRLFRDKNIAVRIIKITNRHGESQ